MGKIKFIVGLVAIVAYFLASYFILHSNHALVTHPKGMIAHQELDLIITNTILMLIVIVPTFILLLIVAWKYRADNKKTEYRSKSSHGFLINLTFWIVPSIVVAAMAVITWNATHQLDPYKPLESGVKPLKIQVVALNWKWLFIYPDQEIATVNYVEFPEKTPIHFVLSADGSPMNSFWIPELSGQIYCMTGMITPLHMMADAPGVYSGKAAEINGQGYARMNFVAKSSSPSDFEDWVAEVKESSLQLTEALYDELIKPSESNPITFYSYVEDNLFNKIIMKYMPHNNT